MLFLTIKIPKPPFWRSIRERDTFGSGLASGSYGVPLSTKVISIDDGPGFKKTDNDDPHIALNNIIQRLEMMCKGTLEISTRKEGGTSVKVIIP